MFAALARTVHRWRLAILVASISLTVGASIWGPGIFREVSTAGSFTVEDSQSHQVAQRLSEVFPESDYDVIAVVSPDAGKEPETDLKSAVNSYVASVDRDRVSGIATPWALPVPGERDPSAGANPLLSEDGSKALVLMSLTGAEPQSRNDDFVALRDSVRVPRDYVVSYAGAVPTEEGIGAQTKADVTKAEMLSMPVLSVLLIIVFGSLTSSLLPVLVGGAATVGSFAALRLIAGVTDVSIFAITISSILALVLAVDYGLFIVSRYRDELARGRRGVEALIPTLRTAGETVCVSGLLVLVSLGVLMLFPQNFLKSMALGGIATVLVALLFALVVLPAFLAVLGPRIDSLRVPGRRLKRRPERTSPGLLHRVAGTVMRRPVLFVALTLAVLVPLAAPALQLRLGSVDHRVLPPDHSVARTAELINKEFPGVPQQPVNVLVEGAPTSLAAYLDEVDALPGVESVRATGVSGSTTRLEVVLTDDWQSDSAVDVVKGIRGLPTPADARVSVGGMTAEMVDQNQAIAQTAPKALGILLVSMLLLLGFAFQSVVLPLKAVLMNLLSVGAALGVMVWIFQQGHLAELLGFTATGTLDPSNLILVFCLLFGLSMDYEVFMLSRVKEEYDATQDNRHSVATGLQATGSIITAAAGLLLVVVGAFSFSGIAFIKMIGVGMITAIVIDVLVIRGLLVPATMRLFGDLNWWPGHRGRRGLGRHLTASPTRREPGPTAAVADVDERRPDQLVRSRH